MKSIKLLLFFIVMILSKQSICARYRDSTSAVSQAESVVQTSSYNTGSAKKTQESVTDKVSILLRVTSRVDLTLDGNESINKMQERFVYTLEQNVNKQHVHVMDRGNEQELDVMRGTSSSIDSLDNGVAKPAHVLLSKISTDDLFTGTVSATNNQFRLSGTVDFVMNVENPSYRTGLNLNNITAVKEETGGFREVKKIASGLDQPYHTLDLNSDFVQRQTIKTSTPRSVTKQNDELQITKLISDIRNVSLSTLSAPTETSCAHKRIIGYIGSWSSRSFTVEQSLHLTNVIYAFISMDSEGNLIVPATTTAKRRLLDLMMARQAQISKGLDLKVSFALGGAGITSYFPAVIGDPAKRFTLIAAIAKIMQDFRFDGVDIDWEDFSNGKTSEEIDCNKQNFVKFLNELRHALGDDYLISMAGMVSQRTINHFDLENIAKVVNWIGVMCYDFYGTWNAYVGPNALLYHGAPPGYSSKANSNWALKHYVCSTKQPNKIVMGVPFYGRYWSRTVYGKDPVGYPLYRKAEKVHGKYGGSKSYRQLVMTWLSSNSSFDKHWDNRTKTPWAIHPGDNLVLTYDDPESIKLKVDYAIEHNLGGVMIWSVEQDDDQLSLLKTVSSNACRPTNNSIKYKCSPLKDKRWWTWDEDRGKAGLCGKAAPLYKGYYPVCDPDDPASSCCSKQGRCGSGPKFCDCDGCIDYGKNPEKLIEEPVKPSRPVQWHVRFDVVKRGQPRCGARAKPLDNGFYAICNPDDPNAPCCSRWGYCGNGKENCECALCKDYRKISVEGSMQKVTTPGEIQWHVGSEVVKPGEPRCGPSAPKVNGKMPICNPDDDEGYCCSKRGFCGKTADYCECDGCFNFRLL